MAELALDVAINQPARASLGEVKRRTKVIGPFPGETSCLTVVWAVLDLYITHGTNGVGFTQLERQRLKRIKYEGHVSRAGRPGLPRNRGVRAVRKTRPVGNP